jgi:ClpP class serine protease
MRNIHIISALAGILAIHREKALNYLPLLDKALKEPAAVSKVTEAEDKDLTVNLPFLSNLYYVSEFGYAAPPENASPGSVAVIGFTDIITRHDGWWWSGMYTKADLVQRALQNPNIEGVILYFDTPGGEASAPDVIQPVIRGAQKPIHSYVDGLCASAAYEIAAGSKSITARSAFSYVGSIGTFTTIADYKGYWEKNGIKIIELYADDSDLKNFETRELLENDNIEPLQARINELNDLFIASVKQDRGNLITDPKAYRGLLYNANAAISGGLIDGIDSLDALMQSIKGTTSSYSSNQTYIIC